MHRRKMRGRRKKSRKRKNTIKLTSSLGSFAFCALETKDSHDVWLQHTTRRGTKNGGKSQKIGVESAKFARSFLRARCPKWTNSSCHLPLVKPSRVERAQIDESIWRRHVGAARCRAAIATRDDFRLRVAVSRCLSFFLFLSLPHSDA